MFDNATNSKKLLVMIGVMSAMFLFALDQTIVATAMPKIVSDLKGLEHLTWVFTGYLLASTVTIPIYGKLSDMYGRKTYYLFGIIVFVLGSMLSGLSQNMIQLIAFRTLQGIGGGAIMTNSFAIVGDLFTPKERGRWQGLLGGVFALAFVAGPMLGGFITDNASWRWNFYINLPIGIVSFILVSALMPKIHLHLLGRKIDYQGALTLSIGLICLILGLVWGGNIYPWGSFQILLLFGAAFLAFILFLVIERRAPEPIIPLNLFRNSIFSVSVLMTFLTSIGIISGIIYIPLFGQKVLGANATDSGTMLMPLMLSMVGSSALSGQLISRIGRYKLLSIVGTLTATVSLYLLSFISATTTRTELILKMVILGAGLGLTIPILMIAVQNAFGHSKLGVVTAASQLFRNIGSTVGVAVTGGILNSAITQDLTGENPRRLFAYSIGKIYLAAAVFVAIAFLLSFFLREIPLRKSHDESPMQ